MLKTRQRRVILFFAFGGPLLAMLFSLNIVPIAYSVWLSVHDWRPTTQLSPPFVGIGNFFQIFQDVRFGNSLMKTLLFIAGAISIEFILGLAIALAISKKEIRGKRLIRTVVSIPMMIAPLVIGFLFRLLFHPTAGVINYTLNSVGIASVEWVSSSRFSLVSIMIADIWEWTPFMVLIILSGVQALPVDIYEAAWIDGASRFQAFKFLTLPLLLPIISVGILLRIIDAFRTFDVVYVLTGGGPGISSELVSLYTYRVAFGYFKLGYAAAMSWILLCVTIAMINRFFTKLVGE